MSNDEDPSVEQKRRWCSWEDYMREWCLRDDFRRHLPDLLVGEDTNFVRYIAGLADEAAKSSAATGPPAATAKSARTSA